VPNFTSVATHNLEFCAFFADYGIHDIIVATPLHSIATSIFHIKFTVVSSNGCSYLIGSSIAAVDPIWMAAQCSSCSYSNGSSNAAVAPIWTIAPMKRLLLFEW